MNQINTRGEFSAHVGFEIPEEVELHFHTNGFQGGDAGHGGETVLEIKWEGGSHSAEVIEDKYSGGSVIFTACGDWELAGLVRGLVELGDKLRPLATQMEIERVAAEKSMDGAPE